MKAGAKWKQGADTCVFKPAVKCEGESDVRPGISRIQPDEIAAHERQVEEVLKARFPRLIEDGSITVSNHVCVPEFTDEDLQNSQEVAEVNVFKALQGQTTACMSITKEKKGLTNFITPERGIPYNESPIKDAPDATRYKVIRNVLNAMIELVPDSGPWVIHTDVNARNILIDGERSTLIDWGRSIVIQNPNDKREVDEEITRKWDVFRKTITFDRFLQTALLSSEARPALRGWMMYVLFKQVFPNKYWSSILEVNSQIDLVDLIKVFDEEFAPPAPAPAPITAPTTVPVSSIRQALVGKQLRPGLPQGTVTTPAPAPAPAPAPEPAPAPAPAPKKFQLVRTAQGYKTVATGGVYWPAKYHRGLTQRQNLQRKRSATRRTKMSWKNPKAYAPFKSDKGVKTRKSSYSSRFHSKYPEAKTVGEIAKATGISKSILDQVYNRGMAAWRTGHRPGASQHAWGMARVHSFVLKGKTWRTADADLARKVSIE